MAEMMDCLVTYYSLETDSEGRPRRYLAYRILAGPGPIAEGSVATIKNLVAYNENQVCDTCEHLFAVNAGGPMAGIEEALAYLDAFHETDRLEKAQTEVQSYPCQDQGPARSEPRVPKESRAAVPRIEPANLIAAMSAGQRVTILDVRSAEAWNASAVRIPGAIRVDPTRFHDDPTWPSDRLTVVYCTCPGDAGAAQVAGRLRSKGFFQASVLRGGFEAWEASGGPVEPK